MLAPLVLVAAAVVPARAAGLTITATFDSSLTQPEIDVINTAIAFYQNTFTDPVNVTIKFQDMPTGLGQSQSSLYKLSYTTVITALHVDANAISADDALVSRPQTFAL